jgi:hypothetical protein
MEWIKIKVKHILYVDLTCVQVGTLIKLQALTAGMERIPSKKEMMKHVHHKQLKSLEESLENIKKESDKSTHSFSEDVQDMVKECSRDLQGVLKEVLRDVQEVRKERLRTRARKEKSRSNNENVTRDVPRLSLGREEQSREEKNIKSKQACKKNNQAAASFLKVEVEEVVNQIVSIRIKSGEKKNNPIKNPSILKGKLIDAYKSNPEELEIWKKQIQQEKENNEKKIRDDKKQTETLNEVRRREDEQEKSSEKIRQNMDIFKSLPESEQQELREEAEKIIRDESPGIKTLFEPAVRSEISKLIEMEKAML